MNFEKLRERYKPEHIKLLLIAETPPKADSNRFFYMENVQSQDSLFLEVIKVLYPDTIKNKTTKEIRNIKPILLNKLKNDGIYLIDSLEEPFEEKYNTRKKVSLIQKGQKSLLEKIKEISHRETKVVLISSTVFQANYLFLKSYGVNIIHDFMIDFPGSGGQVKFREKFEKTIQLN